MESKKIVVLALALICFKGYAITMSDSDIRGAVAKMSQEEVKTTELHLRKELVEAKNSNNDIEIERYELLLQQLNKGKFDLVIQELKALGDDPQRILKTTGLRQAMLEGKLEKIPWFMREIAGLEWFFDQDKKRSSPRWPQPKDKVLYLAGLVDQIDRNHSRVMDKEMLNDGIVELQIRLNDLRPSVNKVFQRTADQALEKLAMVKKIRGL